MLTKLIDSVKIQTAEKPLDCLAISSGVQLINSEAYHAGCYLPRSDWRKPSRQELEVLMAEPLATMHYSKVIKTIKMPQNLAELCSKMQFDSIIDRRDIRKNFSAKQELFEEFNELMNNYLLSFEHEENCKVEIHAFPIASKGLKSITRRYMNGSEDYRFCGLHVDCDSGASTQSCRSARNRISINLTSEPRQLFFTNISVDDMIGNYKNHLSIPDECIENRNDIASNFLSKNSTYPVIRLTIQPYEAYIAPTDNIIHEASTLGRTIEDVTLVALGKFK